MTLVTAWVRRTAGAEELIVASDSRLTGGIALNHAPKLFPLARNDAVLAYCGPTVVAYPILLQLKASLDVHEESRDRIIDIVDLKAHIEKSIERLRAQIKDLPSKDLTDRAFKFLLAGYSWRFSKFRVWTFRYDTQTGEFNARSMPRNGHHFAFMSDVEENEKRARFQLMRTMFRDPKQPKTRLDWEPLQVLLSFIRDPECNDIGGPPQIMKIYRHANILPINVLWPEDRMKNGLRVRTFEINHLGRPLLDYEQTRLLTLDPELGDLIEPWNIREHAKAYNDCEERRLRGMLQARVARLLSWREANLQLQERLKVMLRSGASLADLQAVMGQ